MTAYGEAAYRAALQSLRAETWQCWYGCGRRATTPDHWPPLAEHRHEAGTGCCQLRPSCSACNLRAGAALGNRHRRTRSRLRLTPGTGWSS